MRNQTEFVGIATPTPEEEAKGAEAIFIRRNKHTGQIHQIQGRTLYESYQQWGEETDILWDNVEDIENWINSLTLINS